MKTTLIISLFSILCIFSSCEGNKVGQFKAVDSGQPISIGYDSNLKFEPGEKVYLHQYANGWALAAPDDTLGVLAVFVNEVKEPAAFFASNKTGQFKAINGNEQYSIGYDPNLVLNAGDSVYLHEYTDGWALAYPGDTSGVRVIFVR